MTHLTYLGLTVLAGLLFHGMLWARNGRFLWQRRRIILLVTLAGLVWQAVGDPLGGHWGAWFFDFNQTLGLTLFGVMPIEDLLGAAVVSSAAACAVLVFGYSPRRWI